MRGIPMLPVLVLGCAVSSSALGQAECLASLNVSAGKSVTFLAIGPGAGDKIAQTMTCPTAEKLRGDMFVSGQALDPNLLGNANQLRSKITDIRSRLATHKTELQNAATRAKREAIFGTLKITLAAAGTASAATGCVTSGVSCVAAFGGAVGLYELIDSLANTAGDLAQQAVRARAEIDKILPVLQAVEAQLNDNLAQQGKLRYNVAFTEMCKAIKQQCM